MDRDLSQWVPQVGTDVIGADGEKVGEIDGVERDYFIVRKGFFFPQDHYIPMTAVSSYDDEKVYLNVTKDEALEQDWTSAPVAGTGLTSDAELGAADTYRGADVDAANTTVGTQYDETRGTAAGYTEGDRLAGIDTTDTDLTDRDTLRVPVHEEELTATRRPVERGEVRVSKDVVEEEQQIDVPVTEEHAHVTRRTVDRDVTPDDAAFQEGTIEVPLRGEEVDVEKRARVVEEVDIEKHVEEGTRRVGDTVRREEVRIEGDEVVRDRDVDTDIDGKPVR